MSDKSKRDKFRDLFRFLDEAGLFEFGEFIERAMIYELLGLEMPALASKEVFDRLAMLELAAVDYCRNVLLGHGKYLAGVPSGYRVLLPSENKAQVDAYMYSADRKLLRALKLSRNMPDVNNDQPDQTEARIMMKRKGMRVRRDEVQAQSATAN